MSTGMTEVLREPRRLWFGKYRGQLLERIFLYYPDYAWWLINNLNQSTTKSVVDHLEWCIAEFDKKKIQAPCVACCGRTATRFSVYVGDWDPWPFCSKCDPGAGGAEPWKILIFNKFEEIISMLQHYPSHTRRDVRRIVQEMAYAKGLTKPRTEKKVIGFFHDGVGLVDDLH
jgi:hypothetical protein